MKTIGKIIGTVGKIIVFMIIMIILAPIFYFAWRAGQPMSIPEYDGRTYYQLLAERRQAYDDLAMKYQTGHPNVDVKPGMCFQTELAISLGNTFPWAGICAASEVISALRFYGPKSQQMGCGQMGGTWTNLPATWWRTYEKLLFEDILSTRPQGPVAYCRLPLS